MGAALIHGIILAFGLILPLGVQNVFVFNQGANQPRFISALPVVITASICDTILISLAVLGVSVIVLNHYWIEMGIMLVGIIFLVYMGWVTWNSKTSSNASEVNTLTHRKQIAFSASVSLLNPHAIMDTIGVIGTSSLSYSGVEKVCFALACILVSWIWFFSLALAGRRMGKLDQSGKFMNYLNKISSLIMWGTAIYLLSRWAA